ncbi:CoA-binding protein [Candidatus Neomarinimicrobiota bacterium]
MTNSTIDEILSLKTIAMVGISPKPERASNSVARYMQQQGYTIVPVNPGHAEILGQKCYPDLKSIPHPVDIVDVFRRAEFTPAVTKAAVGIGAKAVWLQLGIANDEARQIAEDAGLKFVMNRCIKIEQAFRETKPT